MKNSWNAHGVVVQLMALMQLMGVILFPISNSKIRRQKIAIASCLSLHVKPQKFASAVFAFMRAFTLVEGRKGNTLYDF